MLEDRLPDPEMSDQHALGDQLEIDVGQAIERVGQGEAVARGPPHIDRQPEGIEGGDSVAPHQSLVQHFEVTHLS